MSENITFDQAMLALNKGKRVKAKLSRYKTYSPIGGIYLCELMKPTTLFKIIPDFVYIKSGNYSKEQLLNFIKELE